MFKSICLLLAASATVLGMPSQDASVKQSKPFKVHFEVGNNTYFSANVLKDTKTGSHLIVGQRLSAYPGTSAYFQTKPSKEDKALIFTVDQKPYGAIVPDIGDNYGIADPIPASLNKAQYQWSVNSTSEQIFHKLYAAPNLFLSCQRKVNGEEYFVLSFGESNLNGTLPEGCEVTKVVRQVAP